MCLCSSRTRPCARCVFFLRCDLHVACLFQYFLQHLLAQAVRTYRKSKIKPPLIVKTDELCGAICKYWYVSQVRQNLKSATVQVTHRSLLIHTTSSSQVVFVIHLIIFLARKLCLDNVSATMHWTLLGIFYVNCGIFGVCYANLLEGKRIATFPWVLCRPRVCTNICNKKARINLQLSGLNLNSELGKALQLIVKYGLDTERQKNNPVDFALESLLSTSTLMVGAAPDMDITKSIEYFLDHCATTQRGESVRRILRAGTESILNTNDFVKLRSKTKSCLQWAGDPERPSVEGQTLDEAAAIMLYTQQTCLYSRLNKALRDHLHEEKLEPFLPYLKLLLSGLNKLPLVRVRAYRGVTLDLHEQYNLLRDRVFTWWAFSSTTTNLDLLNSTTFNDVGGPRTMFTIDAIGVNISAFSAFPDEEEVLLLPGTQLVVQSGVNASSNFWQFEASVYQAVQRHQETGYDSERENESPSSQDTLIRSPRSPRPSDAPFQNIDLPHPGWKAIVCSTNGLDQQVQS